MTERSSSSSSNNNKIRRSSGSGGGDDSNVSDDNDHDDEPRDNNNNSKSSSSSFQYPREFLLRIPKSDLHIHLDGSIRLSTLIQLSLDQQRNNHTAASAAATLPSYDEEELRRTVFPPTYSSLRDYLAGFGHILSVLRSAEALERVAYEVGTDAHRVGVRYLEVRFAPQLHAVPGKLSIEEVICAVNRGLGRAASEADELDRSASSSSSGGGGHPAYHPEAPPHHYGIIVCAMRYFLPTFSPYYEAFCEVHRGEDPHRIFGLASVALVTAVNALKGKRKCYFGYDDDEEEEDRRNANDNDEHYSTRQFDSLGNGDLQKCKEEEEEEAAAAEVSEDDDDFILPIVAIDIAGAESGYPASDHREAFDLAHSSFLFKTVHAGEAYGPESIFSAITDLHAERIGHGCNIFRWDLIGAGEGRGGRSKSNKEKEEMSDEEKRAYVENLTRYLGAMRTCIEVCLSSNLQTMPQLQGNLAHHPARKMIEQGLAVTFCTDNTLVSHTDLARELGLAAEAFGLGPGQLRNIVFNGFKRSFMAMRYRMKRDYNRKVISYYKRVEREFGLSDFGSDYGDGDHA